MPLASASATFCQASSASAMPRGHTAPCGLVSCRSCEGTSPGSPRRRALDEKNAADSATNPPSASRSRGRHRSTSGSSRNFMHATQHGVHLERSQTWSTIKPCTRGRGARGSPHRNPRETIMGRKQRNRMGYLAEQNPRGVAKSCPTHEWDEATKFFRACEARYLMPAKWGRGQI